MKLTLILTALLSTALSLSSATLTWSSSLFTADTQISTTGTQLTGINMGGATTTVNGESFSSYTSTGTFSNTYIRFGNGTTTSTPTYLSTNTYQDPANLGVNLDVVSGMTAADELSLLGHYAEGNGSGIATQLQGLTVGDTYVVQLLIVDNGNQRAANTANGSFGNGTMHISGVGNDWGATYDFTDLTAALLMETTFVADATTNSFRFGTQGVGNWGVNAFQIRTVPVPEPTSAALLGLGGLALVVRRRR